MTIKEMRKQYISTFKKNVSILEFRLRKIDETRNYILQKINIHDLMSEKHKNTCKYLSYVEYLLILVSTKLKKKLI